MDDMRGWKAFFSKIESARKRFPEEGIYIRWRTGPKANDSDSVGDPFWIEQDMSEDDIKSEVLQMGSQYSDGTDKLYVQCVRQIDDRKNVRSVGSITVGQSARTSGRVQTKEDAYVAMAKCLVETNRDLLRANTNKDRELSKAHAKGHDTVRELAVATTVLELGAEAQMMQALQQFLPAMGAGAGKVAKLFGGGGDDAKQITDAQEVGTDNVPAREMPTDIAEATPLPNGMTAGEYADYVLDELLSMHDAAPSLFTVQRMMKLTPVLQKLDPMAKAALKAML